MEIKVKSSTMVKPATAAPETALWLSNWDVMLPEHAHTLTLYFYRPTAADDFFDAAVLTAALSRALVEFYPVAGRLRKDDDGRIEVDCNGEGALFVEAEADADMDDLGDFGPRPDLNLIPKVDYSLGISSFPILLLQVTRFNCGGVCLGISNEHHVFDGISAYHFINTWADLARGVDMISIPPFLDHRVLSARSPPEIKYDHIEFQAPPLLKNPQHEYNSQTVFSTFKLTRDQLGALKASCQEDQGNPLTYTTFEAFTGHVWRCICKARELPEDQETKLYVIVDGRTRLQPPLPPGYFGNAVTKAARIATCGELESNPLRFAVRKVRETLAQMSDDYLRSAIDYLELNGGLAPNARGTVLYKSPNLGVTSWARLPFYEADFGWGRPVYIGVGAAPAEGHIIVLPSPINDGSLLLALSLPRGQLELFEKLFYHI